MDKQLNLEVLHKQFIVRGKAGKALRALRLLIKNRQNRKLAKLLRDHNEKAITLRDEIEFRDRVDYLLEYVSMLYVGKIAGYLPNELPSRAKLDLVTILENNYVADYFRKYYKQKLPSIFLASIESKIEIDSEELFEETSVLFERFLILNNSIRTDEEINQFLWFLDDGETDDYDIHDLIRLLKNKKKLIEAISDDEEDILEASLQGYIKYLYYLDQYADLLKATSKFPRLTVAIFLYQDYWFRKLKRLMGSVFLKGIQNIKDALEKVSSEEYEGFSETSASDYKNQSNRLNIPMRYDEWLSSSLNEIEKIQDSLRYMKEFDVAGIDKKNRQADLQRIKVQLIKARLQNPKKQLKPDKLFFESQQPSVKPQINKLINEKKTD